MKQIGSVTELKCFAAFIENGYTVSIPYGDNARYDCIIDVNGNLLKIQCKTSRPSRNKREGIEFNTKSNKLINGKKINAIYTNKEIDYFATIYKDDVYLVDVNYCIGCSKIINAEDLYQHHFLNVLDSHHT